MLIAIIPFKPWGQVFLVATGALFLASLTISIAYPRKRPILFFGGLVGVALIWLWISQLPGVIDYSCTYECWDKLMVIVLALIDAIALIAGIVLALLWDVCKWLRRASDNRGRGREASARPAEDEPDLGQNEPGQGEDR